MGDSLARLSLFKSAAYVNESGVTIDTELKAVLEAATGVVGGFCGRTLVSDTFTEYYTGNDTKRLYVCNPPIIKVDEIKLWDGLDSYDVEAADNYVVTHDTTIVYPRLGKEVDATWSRWSSDYEDGILVKYIGGYPVAGWDNKTIEDAFGVPNDLEHAVCQIGMKIWYDAKSSGGRFGLMSLSRDGGASFDKFIKGLPDDTLIVLNTYRMGII